MTRPDRPTRPFEPLASRIDAASFRTCGFTSALSGEGVSTTALGTALALASEWTEPVLLVDANWAHPSLTQDAHLDSAIGLTEVLAGKASLAAAARSASGEGLAFLPIGDRALAKPTLRSLSTLLADQFASRYRMVVDLPPVLASEALVLPWAALLDQTFIVLREAATPVATVREAVAKLGFATTAHIVLNRGTLPSPDLAFSLLAART